MNRLSSALRAPFALLGALAMAAGLLVASVSLAGSAQAAENINVDAPYAGVVQRQFFSTQVEFEGGRAPYTFRITDGRLPDGVGINSQGVISGRPTKAGDFCFTVKVSDRRGNTGSDVGCIFVYRAGSIG